MTADIDFERLHVHYKDGQRVYSRLHCPHASYLAVRPLGANCDWKMIMSAAYRRNYSKSVVGRPLTRPRRA